MSITYKMNSWFDMKCCSCFNVSVSNSFFFSSCQIIKSFYSSIKGALNITYKAFDEMMEFWRKSIHLFTFYIIILFGFLTSTRVPVLKKKILVWHAFYEHNSLVSSMVFNTRNIALFLEFSHWIFFVNRTANNPDSWVSFRLNNSILHS